MTVTPLRFIHCGYGNMLCANRIVAIFPHNSATSKRMLEEAKANNMYVSLTFGHALKTIILLEDGRLAGCTAQAKTLAKRIDTLVRESKEIESVMHQEIKEEGEYENEKDGYE